MFKISLFLYSVTPVIKKAFILNVIKLQSSIRKNTEMKAELKD